MRKLHLFLIQLFLVASIIAQAPAKLPFQAVVRDANGDLLKNQSVGVQISILKGSVSGSMVFIETHSALNLNTNINGLLTLNIGEGNIVAGSLDKSDWGNGDYFLKTEIDPKGGNNYSIQLTSPLLSVPYALHANTAEKVSNDKVFDGDSSAVNEIQVLELTTDSILLKPFGKGVSLDDISKYVLENQDRVERAAGDTFYASDTVMSIQKWKHLMNNSQVIKTVADTFAVDTFWIPKGKIVEVGIMSSFTSGVGSFNGGYSVLRTEFYVLDQNSQRVDLIYYDGEESQFTKSIGKLYTGNAQNSSLYSCRFITNKAGFYYFRGVVYAEHVTDKIPGTSYVSMSVDFVAIH